MDNIIKTDYVEINQDNRELDAQLKDIEFSKAVNEFVFNAAELDDLSYIKQEDNYNFLMHEFFEARPCFSNVHAWMHKMHDNIESAIATRYCISSDEIKPLKDFNLAELVTELLYTLRHKADYANELYIYQIVAMIKHIIKRADYQKEDANNVAE